MRILMTMPTDTARPANDIAESPAPRAKRLTPADIPGVLHDANGWAEALLGAEPANVLSPLLAPEVPLFVQEATQGLLQRVLTAPICASGMGAKMAEVAGVLQRQGLLRAVDLFRTGTTWYEVTPVGRAIYEELAGRDVAAIAEEAGSR